MNEQMKDLFQKIVQGAEKRRLLAVFDRDGTLAPICATSEAATIPTQIKILMRRLACADGAQVGILSARSLSHLLQDFPDDELILSGNYGLEILFPDKRSFVHPQAELSRSSLSEVRKQFEAGIKKEACVIVDDHDLSLCFHWHLTPDALQEPVHDLIRRLKDDRSDLWFRTLPTSYEVLPPIPWDKGHGLEKIVQMLEFDDTDLFVVYVGDSEFDEPAFKWVNEHQGMSIRIGLFSHSAAQFHLPSSEELTEFIRFMVDLRCADHE